MRKIYSLVCFLILFQSCSNGGDDSNDIIIGKWQIIETYQSGVLVETNQCLQYVYAEFKIDKVMVSGFINYDLTPANCIQSTEFQSLVWKKNGSNSYEIGNSFNELVLAAYFEGNNLITESSNLPLKFVYKAL